MGRAVGEAEAVLPEYAGDEWVIAWRERFLEAAKGCGTH
jgi:hypothetical protein